LRGRTRADYASPICDRRIFVEQRPRTTGECDLPRGLADATRRAGEDCCLLALRRFKPGIILPLHYETLRFVGLAASFRPAFLMTTVILSDR
jgi:hypothetical protein